MGDYHNDTNQVRNSHNINRNQKNCNSLKVGKGANSNINVMKSDTYNVLLALIAFLTIIICLGSTYFVYSELKKFEVKTDAKIEVISTALIKRGLR